MGAEHHRNVHAFGVVVFAASLLFLPRITKAEDRTELAACPWIDRSTLDDFIQIEIDSLDLEAHDIRFRVSCADPSAVAVEVHLPGCHRRRLLAVGEPREPRTGVLRLVAITLSELAATCGASAGRDPTSQRASAEAARPPEPKPTTTRSTALAIAGGYLGTGEPWIHHAVGMLSLDFDVSERFAIGLDVGPGFGSVETPSAVVTLASMTASLRVDLHVDTDRFRFSVGLGLRASALIVEGQPTDPAQRGDGGSSLWVAPLLSVGADVLLTKILFVGLRGEAGWALTDLAAVVDDGEALLHVRGAYVAALLRAGVRL